MSPSSDPRYFGKSPFSHLKNASEVAAKIMRGETVGAMGKTFSWAWRNLLLTPKAGAQYAKTILSIPTHIRYFLSSGAFALGNGTLFENPQLMKEALQRAGVHTVRSPAEIGKGVEEITGW